MEITTTTENKYPAILDSFVQQGRACLMSAAQNLLMFGRVITEAKPHIPHGQFENWVRDSFGISVRTAQNYMSVYKRFGDREAFSGIRYTTLREMLALPDGEEETFIAGHAVGDMSTREVREAVDKAVKKHMTKTQNCRRCLNQSGLRGTMPCISCRICGTIRSCRTASCRASGKRTRRSPCMRSR